MNKNLKDDNLKFLLAGDSSLVIEFGNEISPKINRQIRILMDSLKEANLEEIIELIPTYRSLLITYNPLISDSETLENKIKELYSISTNQEEDRKITLIEIPTLYNNEFGIDLEYVAEYNNLTQDEVIKIHTETDYLVYMLGFMPGFTYLGGMSEKIATPRLESPRLKILSGSVGIAGKQTGMYPSESPGGWRIIGRTPLKLYDIDSDSPVFINSGDYIRYISITQDEYEEIEKEVLAKNYKIKISKIKKGDLNV